MRREGKSYLRVMDYKTGSKAFRLDDVYCGLNTQMLLYLFTLCRNGGERFQAPEAAGVLYLLSDPAPGTVARTDAQGAPVYKVDGLVLDDPVVLHGMDRDATGLFVPVSFTKGGAPRASAKLASLEKLGEIEKHIEGLVVQMARGLYAGEIAATPLLSGAHSPCAACEFRPVCRHEDGRDEQSVWAPPNVFSPKQDDIDEEV
jgi:ATP-dependent helicase/nuclease subunit B